MDLFSTKLNSLLTLLTDEGRHQEQLLSVLTRERCSIVKLNGAESEKLREEKEKVLAEAFLLESKRAALLREIVGAPAQSSNKREPKVKPKLTEALAKCPPGPLKKSLQAKAAELRVSARRAKELNHHNAQLLEQALSIISSTLSIIQSSPGTELPTYSGQGELKNATPDPAFSKRRSISSAA